MKEGFLNFVMVLYLFYCPVFISIVINRPKIIQILLDHGADINIQNQKSQETPLFRSIILKHYEISLLLLRNGANPNICNSVQ